MGNIDRIGAESQGHPRPSWLVAVCAISIIANSVAAISAGATPAAALPGPREVTDWDDRFFPRAKDESLPVIRELVLDRFDAEGSWNVSMSSDDGRATIRFFPAGPESARPGALGLRVDFLHRGDAYVVVRPSAPILAEGRCLDVSVRVLGRGFSHDLRLIVGDYYGRSYELPMGKLVFSGWRTLHVAIPAPAPGSREGIVQDDSHYDRPPGLRILGLKIAIRPEEAVGSFYVYFSDLRALCEATSDGGEESYEISGSPPPLEATNPSTAAGIGAAPNQGSLDDAAKIGAILATLKERIAGRLSFPAAARRRGVEGTMSVSIVIDERGGLVELRLLSSSGSGILDEAGLELLRSVLPVENGTGRRIRLEVPITYRLVDAPP